MIRIRELQERFRPLVGWEGDGTLPADLTESESGLYYQQRHALLTLDNIRSILTNAELPEWDSEQGYEVGAKVVHSDGQWKAEEATTASEEPGVSDKWGPYDELTEYLRRATDSGIATMVNKFVENKSMGRTSKALLEHKTLFDGSGRTNNVVEQTHSLVGWELEPMRNLGVTVKIHRIGLQMRSATGVVTLYLFHSSLREPVKVLHLDVQQQSTYQWFSVQDMYLPYLGSKTNSGGKWYLCYHEDDLPEGMEAVNMPRDFSKDPCHQCGGGNVNEWRNLTRYVRVSPFSVTVESGWSENPEMWDSEDLEYRSKNCYGINIELSIGCDLTDFMIAQRSIFANVLQTQVAYDVLRAIAYNPNAAVNRNQSNVQRQEFIFELDGNTYTRSSGIRGELDRAYKALEVDTEGMDSVCVPCRRRGVNYGGV